MQLVENPPAPACQGHQGCVFRYNSLLTIIGHAFSYQAICCYLFSGPKSVVDYHPCPPGFGYVTSPKIHHFSCLFSKHKKPEKQLPGLQKSKKSTLESIKKNSEKRCVLQYLPSENLDLRAPRVEISTPN